MNLILIRPSELSAYPSSSPTPSVTLGPNDERTKHIIKHLRKKSGDTVNIGIVGGSKGRAVLHNLVSDEDRDNGSDNGNSKAANSKSSYNDKSDNRGGVRLVLRPETLSPPSPNEPQITLLLAIPFPRTLKSLWPTISSFSAVTRIILFQGMLSDPEFLDSSALKPNTYEPLIEKGMSQGGRTRPIKVDVCLEEMKVSREFLERLGLNCNDKRDYGGNCTARIFLDCGDETTVPPPVRDIVLKHCRHNMDAGRQFKESINSVSSAILAVGPERGWTDEEAKIFTEKCGFEAATLGSSILRVDTAVIAGLGIVSAALDECHREGRTNNDCVHSKRQRVD